MPAPDTSWQPTSADERYVALDVLRGLALLGVLIVNVETLFRMSLFERVLGFYADTGPWNRLVSIVVAGLLETKAFSLFSFMFGIGLAIQAERAAARSVNVTHFLVRRLVGLLVIGLSHLFLIWNGDILTLYAVCGLLIVPLSALPASILGPLGAAVIVLPSIAGLPITFPTTAAFESQITAARLVYATGNFLEILAFRYDETLRFMAPLIFSVLPQTLGLMLCGIAAWRAGIVREPQQHKRLLTSVLVIGFLLGGTMTSLKLFSDVTGHSVGVAPSLLHLGSFVPLAFAYGAATLMWLTPARASTSTALFAAMGQMALTNYLTQSVVLGFIFYGYGLGLFGRVASAPAALIGIAIYVAQLFVSRAWLAHYRFGPIEWLWRSLTYGGLQPMRHV